MKITIVGGKGFIGRNLQKFFQDKGASVIIGARNPHPAKPNEFTLDHLPYADVCINLAGYPIHYPWFSGIREKIWISRISVTQKLIERLNQNGTPLLIQASAVGWYGVGMRHVDENSIAHSGWSHDLCQAWEDASKAFKGTRHIVRLGVVLGQDGGFLKMITPSYRLGFRTIMGTGKQGFFWIHINDLCAIIAFLMQHQTPMVVNATSPQPVSQSIFAESLGSVLGSKLSMQVPEFVFRLLPHNMGNELFTQTPFVFPRVLETEGFAFQFSELQSALKSLLIP